MAAMDGPEKVVNAVIRASVRPRKELAVGWKAKSAKFFHRLFPHFTERLSANVVHKYQIKTAPPAADTSGSLYKPVPTGRGVSDGVRERIRKEKKQKTGKEGQVNKTLQR